jgi:NAD(P)H dehydrogenase (quinone)
VGRYLLRCSAAGFVLCRRVLVQLSPPTRLLLLQRPSIGRRLRADAPDLPTLPDNNKNEHFQTTALPHYSTMTKIAIVYYSTYGHLRTLAQGIKTGLESAGATVDMLQVPETLPQEVLDKMGAPPKSDDEIVTADRLVEYDGIMFGVSARYGGIPAQMKAFLDSTGGLWQKGALVGKPAGVFVSTGCQGGGQETSCVSVVHTMAHHGMVFVPLGYRDSKAFNVDEIHGGSPWGAGTIAAPTGARMPSQLELDIAETQGKAFAGIVEKLAA